MFLAQSNLESQIGKLLPGSPASFLDKNAGIHAWEGTLKTTALGKFTNTYFAYIEIFHFIGLALIGASVILTCMRLCGLGLKEESTSTVEKNTRWFLHIGAIMAIGSGLMMGVGNADKLYNSEIFTAKMIAMIAGLVFSYAVMIPTAQREGTPTQGAKVGAAIGMLLWFLALLIFAVRPTANVGWFHMLSAGAVILFATLQGKMRTWLVIGLAVLLIPWQFLTHVTFKDSDPQYMPVNMAFMYLSGLFIFGLSLLNIFGKGAAPGSNAFSRMIGYATILMWITVGAGGRWIGLS